MRWCCHPREIEKETATVEDLTGQIEDLSAVIVARKRLDKWHRHPPEEGNSISAEEKASQEVG